MNNMAQVKLSKAQIEVLDHLKEQINNARKYDTVAVWLEGTE